MRNGHIQYAKTELNCRKTGQHSGEQGGSQEQRRTMSQSREQLPRHATFRQKKGDTVK